MFGFTGTHTTANPSAETEPDDEFTKKIREEMADEAVILLGLFFVKILLSKSKWPAPVRIAVMERLERLIAKYSDNLGIKDAPKQ